MLLVPGGKGFGLRGLGFRVSGLGFRVLGPSFGYFLQLVIRERLVSLVIIVGFI